MHEPYILVVDDEPGIRDLVKEILEDEGYRVQVADSTGNARVSVAEQTPNLVLLDIWMPGEDGISLLKDWHDRGELSFPVVMMSGHGTVETAVGATRLGAFDFVEKPLSLAKLLIVVEKALASSVAGAQPEVGIATVEIDTLTGRSQYIEDLRQQIERLGETDANVLVTGEVASGRELVLHHIHKNSARAGKPFISVRCDTLDERNAALELFGSEHAGAINPGVFEQAQGGILHLSEVGELPLPVQSMLLSTLRAKHFSRVGGIQTLPLNVRLMSSSNVDLQRLLVSGEFDENLYYTLNVLPVYTLGLREHLEDIPALVSYYVDQLVERENLSYRHFDIAVQNCLRNYAWPGNIRELKNLVQRLLVMGNGVEVGLEEVERALRERDMPIGDAGGIMAIPLELSLREARAEFERSYLQQQLKATDGNIGELAKRVGMERTHLYRKLRSLGIQVGRQRN